MRPELHTEMLRILQELSKGEKMSTAFSSKDDKLKDEAVQLLEEHGALHGSNFFGYRITVSGYDYLEELKGPKLYWAKKNWFPVAVLIVTSAVTVFANIIGSVVDAWLN